MCTCIFCTVIYISLLVLFLTIYVFGSSLSLNTHISERDSEAAPLLVYYIKEFFWSFLEYIYNLVTLVQCHKLVALFIIIIEFVKQTKGNVFFFPASTLFNFNLVVPFPFFLQLKKFKCVLNQTVIINKQNNYQQ